MVVGLLFVDIDNFLNLVGFELKLIWNKIN